MTWDDVGRWIGTWDWGTFPEYLGAFGTVVAVGAALWIARRDGKRFEVEQASAAADRKAAAYERAEAAREREDFRKERDEARTRTKREFAEKVSIHHKALEPMYDFEERVHRVSVHNDSEGPAFGATVVLVPRDGEQKVLGLWHTIPAGNTESTGNLDRSLFEAGPFSAWLFFRDSRGYWSRDLKGALVEHAEEDWWGIFDTYTRKPVVQPVSAVKDQSPESDGPAGS